MIFFVNSSFVSLIKWLVRIKSFLIFHWFRNKINFPRSLLNEKQSTSKSWALKCALGCFQRKKFHPSFHPFLQLFFKVLFQEPTIFCRKFITLSLCLSAWLSINKFVMCLWFILLFPICQSLYASLLIYNYTNNLYLVSSLFISLYSCLTFIFHLY